MNSEQKQMRSFKVKSESGEVRRFRIPTEGERRYAELSKIVMSLFNTNSFKLCYTDDEGDRILIESSCELDVALDLMPDLVALSIISEKEEGPVRGGRRCGAGRGRGGRGRGACGRGAFRCGGVDGNGNGNGRRGGAKKRLDTVNSKIAAIEARLCVGEEGVMLLWKKKNLECKKSFLMDHLNSLEKEKERGEGEKEEEERGEGQKKWGSRYNMVCSKLQILGEFLETEEGAQHEGLLSKKTKFEQKKACMEVRRAAMEERRGKCKQGRGTCMEARRAAMEERRGKCKERREKRMEERRGASMEERRGKRMEERGKYVGERRGKHTEEREEWLKRVEAKLEKMQERELQDGFKMGDGFVWKKQKLEQKRLLLQAMLKEENVK